MALGAVLALLAADRVAWSLAPPRALREVEDAVRDLRAGDPTTLVIGSSHGRTFETLGDSLRARTSDRERVLAVPVEWGKLSSYRWVLEHRLLPLFDELGETGARRRTALRRAIIVTEWWDSCVGEDRPRNLPARSWTWGDYASDVGTRGLTDYNSNFLGNRWSRLWRRSALVQDRGRGMVLSAARQRIVPSAPEATRANFERQVKGWQEMVEDGDRCLGAPREIAALDAMLDSLQARELDVTVLLYPRMPITLTARAMETTIPRFAAIVREHTRRRGIRVVDLTTGSPLTDEDFGGDFDHVLPEGNASFAGWALDGPLAFLLERQP